MPSSSLPFEGGDAAAEQRPVVAERFGPEALATMWNRACGPAGLASVHLPLSASSRSRVATALRADPSPERWEACFRAVAESDFLRGLRSGTDGRAFRADFWWVLKPDKRDAILAGRYAEIRSEPGAGRAQRAGDMADRLLARQNQTAALNGSQTNRSEDGV